MGELQAKEAASLQALRRFVERSDHSFNARLPPERELAQRLGLSRAQLRKALAVLEDEGKIWRHVGRGTFVGGRPAVDGADLAYLGDIANPQRVMEARLAVEPPLARLAAQHGVKSDFDRIERLCKRCRNAREWRSYEANDDALHRAVAIATQNKVLVDLFDRLNTARRTTVWHQLRLTQVPPRDHLSFHQHQVIAEKIASRDVDGAEAAMHEHLVSVGKRLLCANESQRAAASR
ncbi:MAG: FCD domain-containing protein [Pseudomonadota bacterium]